MYYTSDTTIQEGDLVSLAGNGVSQVQKSIRAYDSRSLGIISTKPGIVIGAADGTGKPVIVGLSGRVPVKISTKNGDINPGDYITTSDISGVGMRATRAGHVIGKALTGFAGGSEGIVMVFIQNTYFDGVYDDVITPLTNTATGILKTDSMITTSTYSVPGPSLISSPVVTTSTPTPLVPISQSIAKNDADYLAALASTARDVQEKIVATIMTGVHLIRDLVVLQITALNGYFDQVWTRETHTEKICVGTTGNETCITKDQLDALIRMSVTASGTMSSTIPVIPAVTTPVVPTTTTVTPKTSTTIVATPTETTPISTVVETIVTTNSVIASPPLTEGT